LSEKRQIRAAGVARPKERLKDATSIHKTMTNFWFAKLRLRTDAKDRLIKGGLETGEVRARQLSRGAVAVRQRRGCHQRRKETWSEDDEDGRDAEAENRAQSTIPEGGRGRVA